MHAFSIPEENMMFVPCTPNIIVPNMYKAPSKPIIKHTNFVDRLKLNSLQDIIRTTKCDKKYVCFKNLKILIARIKNPKGPNRLKKN